MLEKLVDFLPRGKIDMMHLVLLQNILNRILYARCSDLLKLCPFRDTPKTYIQVRSPDKKLEKKFTIRDLHFHPRARRGASLKE